MKYRGLTSGLLCLVVGMAGCDGVVDVLFTPQVKVTLVNTSADYNIDATVVYDQEDDTFKELLLLIGTELDLVIGAGETVSFSRDCDDLRALVLKDADLRVLPGVSPDTDSDLLRDGRDFDCGDEIVFTFTHPALPTTLSVDIDVR